MPKSTDEMAALAAILKAIQKAPKQGAETHLTDEQIKRLAEAIKKQLRQQLH
ncbi:MAG: hypothetical protein ACP5D0_03200 [Hydrogenovibrio sp.]